MGALATHSALTFTSTTATTTAQLLLSRRSSLTLCSAESFALPQTLPGFVASNNQQLAGTLQTFDQVFEIIYGLVGIEKLLIFVGGIQIGNFY